MSLGFAMLTAAIWSTDAVTLQGERTIYTVDCDQGKWASSTCTGKPLAGLRYRYRALKPHGEVVFWIVGSSDPSGKLVDCTIQDGRSWSCPINNADAGKSITLALKHGSPVSSSAWPTRPFHAVSKVDWYLLKIGISRSHADDPTF
jgi:hypothetical protein